MAGLKAAFTGLRAADAVIRSRDMPDGALMALSAYLMGFALIRTTANSYLYFSSLRMVVPRADAYALAVLGATIACAPLSAALILSRNRPGYRRLPLLPTKRATRLVVVALGPAITALPVILLASALPVLAALPMAAWSLADYLITATWIPATAAALSLGVRSLAGAGWAIAGNSDNPNANRGSQGRTVALAGVLLAWAAANPSPSATDGHAILSLFGTEYLLEHSGGILATRPLPAKNGMLALLTASAAVLFAGIAAIAEEALLRKSQATGSGLRRWNRVVGFQAVWPMASVADRKRDSAWILAACLAFAMTTLAQDASPSIPFAAAVAVLIIRTGSALAFIATESRTTRRFALIPAKPGAADRAYLGTALALATLMVAPLAIAAVLLMGQSFR